MDKNKIRTMRLRKQQISLEKQPLQNALVRREQDLKFYYCLYNLEDDFKNGFYFGLLQLHPGYPFAAPKLFMYTPNGRYECNLAICTSFTNYHQESWTSAWNVRTLIQATISFMYSNEPSYGCRKDHSDIRKKYAKNSLTWNMQNQLFRKLFGQTIMSKLPELVKIGIHIYDKQLCEKLKQLDLFQINQLNLKSSRSAHKNQQNPQYFHKLEEKKILIDNRQEIQIELLGDQQDDILQQVEAQKMRNEERRKRQQQRRKKIKRIIFTLIGLSCGGIFIYFFWTKFVNPSSNSQQTNSLTSSKSQAIFQYLTFYPKKIGQQAIDCVKKIFQKA